MKALWIASKVLILIVALVYAWISWRWAKDPERARQNRYLAVLHLAVFLVALPVLGGTTGSVAFDFLVSCRELACMEVIAWVLIGTLVGLGISIPLGILAHRRLRRSAILRYLSPAAIMICAIIYLLDT